VVVEQELALGFASDFSQSLPFGWNLTLKEEVLVLGPVLILAFASDSFEPALLFGWNLTLEVVVVEQELELEYVSDCCELSWNLALEEVVVVVEQELSLGFA